MAREAAELRGVLDELTRVESQSVQLSRRNVGLASDVLRLAEEAGRDKAEPEPGAEAGQELERLERAVKLGRQKWRIMKGAASAVVAGSGVDWAAEPELRDMVLDPE